MKKTTTVVIAALCLVLVCFSIGCSAEPNSTASSDPGPIIQEVQPSDSSNPSNDTGSDVAPSDTPAMLEQEVVMVGNINPTATAIPELDAADFVSTGEKIDPKGELGWLLAGIMDSEATPIKAELKLHQVDAKEDVEAKEWQKDTTYRAVFEAPDHIFKEGSICAARIFYPSEVKAGGKNLIAIVVETVDGYAYCATAEFTAKNDLTPSYVPKGVVDSVANIQYTGQALTVEFYSSATDGRLNCEGFFEFTDENFGELFVEFVDTQAIDLAAGTAGN